MTATDAAIPRPSENPAAAASRGDVWRQRLTGGGPLFPLGVLFALQFFHQADQSAFNVLLPDIRDAFHMSDTGILAVVGAGAAAGLILTVPIALMADRLNRVALMLIGAAVWMCFSFGTGLALTGLILGIMRMGAGLGQATVFPTHNSLLADYYDIPGRPRVYATHGAALSSGILFGTLVGGGLSQAFNWRVPFIVFAIPVVVILLIGTRLHEPARGVFERAAAGASQEVVDAVEPPPTFGEAYRMVWKVGTLRRIFTALPFVAAAIIGFTSLASIQYDRTFHLDDVQRALIIVPAEAVGLVGIVIGARIGSRLLLREPALIFRLLGAASLIASAFAALFAWAPNLAVAVIAQAGIAACLGVVGPGALAALSLALPPRARSIGFSIGALFVLPGLLLLPIIGGVSDSIGTRWGMLLITPVFLIGGLIFASSGSELDRDIRNVQISTATRTELFLERKRGHLELLRIQSLDVAYDDVQVLFGIDFGVSEGEIVALLGTNGAGKSTLLRAVGGVVEAYNGAVVFDGRDITHMPPEQIAPLGIAQMPGGNGVFPSLTVEENLRAAGWLQRRERTEVDARVAELLQRFEVLAERRDEPAANLSGGQQQMLALAMALLARPKLMLIDELSLGLAPVVVDQLFEMVRALGEQGTAVVIVEQSVNVALRLANRAYFMEKGEIRFSGAAADLLDRPDVLRSVFLEGAAKGLATSTPVSPEAPTTGDRAAADTPAETEAASDERASADDDTKVGNGAGKSGNGNGAPAAETRPTAPFTPGITPMPALAIENLSVTFGGIRAVRDVDLELRHGEIVGVIGPNGAGKTTLFDLVSGFVRPEGGIVRLHGVDITHRTAPNRARMGLGRSFQDSHLFPALTVEETIAVALERWIDVGDPLNAAFRLPSMVDTEAAIAQRVNELIDLLGIEAFRSKFVSELSTGSRRLVDLACVVAHGPSVVLLDEPSSGIAQREAEALAPLLRRIRDRLDASLLVVEHDMALISSLADRLVALDQGAVLAAGTPAEVLEHPDVVASYLGTGPTLVRSGPIADSKEISAP